MGPKLVADVAKNLAAVLGTGNVQTHAFRPRTDGTVKSWIRILAEDLTPFLFTCDSDWDEHAALPLLQYGNGVYVPNVTTLFKAASEEEALQREESPKFSDFKTSWKVSFQDSTWFSKS